jgi:hypothetical protein
VLSDPVDCDLGGIVSGATICVTPSTVPGDLAECDPDGSGTVRFQITDNDCLFTATPANRRHIHGIFRDSTASPWRK